MRTKEINLNRDRVREQAEQLVHHYREMIATIDRVKSLTHLTIAKTCELIAETREILNRSRK
jgi:hypothetical protein